MKLAKNTAGIVWMAVKQITGNRFVKVFFVFEQKYFKRNFAGFGVLFMFCNLCVKEKCKYLFNYKNNIAGKKKNIGNTLSTNHLSKT